MKVRPRWRRLPFIIQEYRWWRWRGVSRIVAFKMAWCLLTWMPSIAPQQEQQ